MYMKELRITEPMQRVAVDILTSLIFAKTIDEVYLIYNEMYNKYKLNEDLFTQLPCTNKEYSKSCDEYYRQSMIDRFGYYE